MPIKRQLLILEFISVAAYVWYCYSVSRMASEEDAMSEAGFWRRAANGCYSIAQRFGSMGIKAETRYNKLIDAERMN
jgi:hypothetical protein